MTLVQWIARAWGYKALEAHALELAGELRDARATIDDLADELATAARIAEAAPDVVCPLCGCRMVQGRWAVAEPLAYAAGWRCPFQDGGCEAVLVPSVERKKGDTEPVFCPHGRPVGALCPHCMEVKP
jgi:hypothetical protein